MENFYIVKGNAVSPVLIEQENFEGVKRIGKTLTEDLEMVSGKLPEQIENLAQCMAERVILIGTVDRSPLLQKLEEKGDISFGKIKGKREVYQIQKMENPFVEFPHIKEMLVVAGSDKRGTIYGMFQISEWCGVSPLVYFGDAMPEKREELFVSVPTLIVSKEPSVRYRGFFINDEWPAFGNWCMEQFGGVNAKAYQKIFELLLRLKGNYLWPAMWRSSFSEDGPGIENAKLADTLGVIMGTSHHEPMCRAGVEWQNQYKQYGEDSTWSFVSNDVAITKFWEEGILRNKDFENVITIGMRGEDDSKLMPEDATLADNIEVIKKAIVAQHKILRENMDNNVPQMLAIYKEVEDYYFGDDTCEGLKDWEELENVIFLLSDDNYGNLRALPDEKMRKHPGGFGMYYHFDYHGAPVSYEWTNCNRLTKTWEQMTQAYEAGVREMWIVNVGDLKLAEYPLCYFMELAYDFETWGTTAPNRTEFFVRKWIDKQFGSRLTEEQKDRVFAVLEGYTKWNAIRSPESMNESVYHPVHFRESDRVWKQVNQVMEVAKTLNEELKGECLVTYQSMIYYPAMASLNLILMYLEAGMNKELAKRGCVYANVYGESVKKRIGDDLYFVEKFHQIQGGKWNHCMSSAHTGFRGWDDKDWGYPTIETVVPIPDGKIAVSFRGSEQYHLGAHWQDKGPLVNDDFMRPDTGEVAIDLDSRGNVSFSYKILSDKSWLGCSEKEGRVEVDKGGRKTILFCVEREKIVEKEEALVTIQILFDNGSKTSSEVLLKAQNTERKAEKESVPTECQGYCAIRAEHFVEKKDVDGKGFQVISYLGREGAAVKAFPPMESYSEFGNAPFVKYRMKAEKSGLYKLAIMVLARNPVVKGGRMRFGLSVNDAEVHEVCAVSESYYTEWFHKEWADGVLKHARTIVQEVSLRQGINDICVYAGDPGVILEKLVLYSSETDLLYSYLGPEESCFE